VVRPIGISRYTADSSQVVEAQVLSYAPRNHVIGARRVTAHPDATDELFHGCTCVKRQPAAEDVDAANLFPDHRIIRGTERTGIVAIGGRWIHGIALLQTEKTAAWLNG